MSDDIKQRIYRLRRDINARLIINGRTVEELDILAICNALEAADKDRDAAIAEAVSQRTVECAGICLTKHFASDAARDILALDAPPAPAYPFGLDASGKKCDHWKKKDDWWVSEHRDFLISDYTHCPFCGAPLVKGE